MRDDLPPIVRDQLRAYANPVSVQVMMVEYIFDFTLTRRVVGGEAMVEIGRNDVGMPLVLSEKDGRLFLLENGQPRFVNSSLSQFLEAVVCFSKTTGGWREDTDECLKEFDSRISAIDLEALKEKDTFWSNIRTEVVH